MGIIISLLINSVSIFIVSRLLSGVHINSFVTAIILAIVLGIINVTIKPVLSLLTLPITIITLGLFSLVINGVLILLADFFIQGFSVDNFLWAVVFSLLVSLINSVLSKFFK